MISGRSKRKKIDFRCCALLIFLPLWPPLTFPLAKFAPIHGSFAFSLRNAKSEKNEGEGLASLFLPEWNDAETKAFAWEKE